MKWLWNADVGENLEALRNKVKRLEALESDNLTEVKNAEIQPGKRPRTIVHWWLKNVKDKKTTFEQIEAEFKEKSPSNNLKKCIENLTKEIDQLFEQGKFHNGVAIEDHASSSIPLIPTELVGQNCSENIESILRWLKEDNAFALGIHGMGGVGKTTLMKDIHNKLLEDFEVEGKVYWVTASQECSLEKLQVDIGKALGLGDLSQEDNERRKASLFRRFSMLGKFVLFLDDLWKHYLIEDIGIPSSLGGCKMILSTRSLDVCNRMKCHTTINVVPFSKSDAMELFFKTLEQELPMELNSIAEKIVEECGGLPLALKTMGVCMRGIDNVHEWKNALCELQTPIIGQDFMKDEVFRVLKFSYNNLKSKKVQHCFLSCVLFPEDHNIERHELVRLWVNEGLFDDVESKQDKESRGQAILNELVKSCLLESATYPDDKDCIKMHDLIRDMAIIITQNNPLFMAKSGTNLEKVPEKEHWSKDLLKVSLSWNNIQEIRSDLSPMTMKLSVLLLNCNPLKKIQETFFVHMRALRVLDLSKTEIKRLPDISTMENLRALLLRECRELTFVPSLEKLVNLRILDLSYTEIERLPDDVSNLENIRELLLVHCKKLSYVPSLARLTNLIVLDLFGDELLRALEGLEKLNKIEDLTYCPWNVKDMSGFCRLSNSFPSLSCYRFRLTPSEEKEEEEDDDYDYDFDFDFHNDWEGITCYNRIVWINGAEFGEDEIISGLILVTIEALSIENSEMKGKRRLGDLFPCLGKTTDLKGIVIKKCRGLEYIMQRPQPGTNMCASLDTLKHLHLRGLPELRRIVEFGGCSFSKLQKLVMVNCPKIKEVFQITNHQVTLPNLSYLTVSDCDEVKHIFKLNNATITGGFPFPKLRDVHISNCSKLKEAFPVPRTNHQQLSFPNLFRLTVQNCKEVEHIFKLNNAPSTLPNPVLALPKLSTFSKLDHLPKLESIYKGLLLWANVNIIACPELKVMKAVDLICDASPSTLASIKSEHSIEWWDSLHYHYPHAARKLSSLLEYPISTLVMRRKFSKNAPRSRFEF